MNNSQQNQSFLMEVTRVFTREEAEASLEHILDHFRNDNHNFVTVEMAKIIELKHTKVLSKGYKSYLRMWANSVGDSRVLGLLEISTDDLDTYSWTEMVGRPILELLAIKSEHTACKDVKSSLVEKDNYQLLENKLKLLQLHAMIEDQKQRASDSQLHMQIRLAELSEEISVVKRDLENRIPVQEESEDPVFTRLRKDRESQPYHFRK
ncbi:hypothetical protein J3E68DRAFT_450433 [Trichoderma sp. SZMC 28012]